jgi:hypothetical protein
MFGQDRAVKKKQPGYEPVPHIKSVLESLPASISPSFDDKFLFTTRHQRLRIKIK